MAVSPKSFLVLEKSLHKRIQKNWNKIKAKKLPQILLKFKDDDLSEVNKIIDTLNLEDAIVDDLKYVKFMGKQAMLFGVSRITPPKDSEALKQKKLDSVVSKAATQLVVILKEASKTMRAKLLKMVGEEFHAQNTVIKAEVLKEFTSSIKTLITAEGNLQTAASLHTSRLAVMGTLIESLAQGKKTTIWNAVLDARTCPICASQDQRVFSVETIWLRMSKAIEAETITDIKRLSPWPSQTKEGITAFQAMTTSELQMYGYDSPPMHPLCRCFLDVTEQPLEVVEAVTAPFDVDRLVGMFDTSFRMNVSSMFPIAWEDIEGI